MSNYRKIVASFNISDQYALNVLSDSNIGCYCANIIDLNKLQYIWKNEVRAISKELCIFKAGAKFIEKRRLRNE